ncbi:helix-turn-helix domain-containing protein [Dactylosporangium sp. CA-139114]|uniref:helix-turn-helix domain-containing protein n=1 Tax=Dactylosporangium sp. CA-139114 TaxID=3239931 RepID=UPI003D95A84E
MNATPTGRPTPLTTPATTATGSGSGSGSGRPSWDAPDIQQQMVRLYIDDRLSIRQVARQMGCAYGTAHRVLHAAHVQMRPKGRHRQQDAPTPRHQRPRRQQDGEPR